MSKIYNLPALKQVVSYDGLGYGGGKYPTDIDGFLDYEGKVFIHYETKYKNAYLEKGQKLAFERKCDFVIIPAFFLVSVHTVSPPEIVRLADQPVKKIYTNVDRQKRWINYEDPCLNNKQWTDYIISQVITGKIKYDYRPFRNSI